MISRKKLRILGVALSMVATASMVATPAYAATGQNGRHVAFRTTAAALEIVRVQNPALHQRLLAYRSGQKVKVTARERAYLQRVNRATLAAMKARATEFSSQSRVLSQEARHAYAQTPKAVTQVVVTPDPWKIWEQFRDWLTQAGPWVAPFAPIVATVIGVAVIIINLIIVIGRAIAAAWPGIAGALHR